MGEAESFGREGGEGAVADDAVGVVAEDVFAGWGERCGAVEAGGEVRGEEGPDRETADEVGAVGKLARGAGAGEEDVDGVWEQDGPEQGDGAEEEEEAEEARYGQGVHQDNEGLKPPFHGDVHGGKPNAFRFGVSSRLDVFVVME